MKRLILTVGPSLLYQTPLPEIHRADYIYRINGAHGTPESIEETVREIRRQVADADILIDLPGNKVRTANLQNPIPLAKHTPFCLRPGQTNYPEFHTHLRPGDTVWANDCTSRFVVLSTSPQEMVFLSQSDGHLGNNKGLHVRGIHAHLPFLFQKDEQLIALTNRHQVGFVGLSFVRTAADVRLARSKLKGPVKVIAKVETRSAVEHLEEVIEAADAILVDRGDLSTEVGLESIPKYQQHIVGVAHTSNRPVFLATQVLKYMEEKPVPTIAEIVDLYNNVRMGIYGIQLSEETAVGKFPRECLEVIDRVVAEVAKDRKREIMWSDRVEPGAAVSTELEGPIPEAMSLAG
jgi:pyruvate kinase